MSLLTIFYWILLLLIAVGVIKPTWEHWPRANALITLILFIIIGIKILKPDW